MKSPNERIEELLTLTDNIDGWLSVKERKFLYLLASSCKERGKIVEIGSWKGRSTICLAKALKDQNSNGKVYAIDPHVGSSEHNSNEQKVWTFEEFKKNISRAGVENYIVPIVKTSKDAATEFVGPVEFIFIDGAHEYELVKLDFDVWFPKVIDDGIMAFHDTDWDGPKQLVREAIYLSNHFRNIKVIDSITYAQKVAKNSMWDKFRNRTSLVSNETRIFFKKLQEFLTHSTRK